MLPAIRNTPLSERLVLVTAVAFIDEHGLASLTMRRLGQILGVEAMALYHHVAGKEQLLDGVVDLLVEDMHGDPESLDAQHDGWQDLVQRLAHGVRRVALAHPKAFPLVASRPPEATWLRPPLRSLDWVEAFLMGLRAEGFSDAACVACYRAFSSFLLGHLLLEVSTLGADLGPLNVLQEDSEPNGLANYPRVRGLRPQLCENHSAAEFREALEALLSKLTLLKNDPPHLHTAPPQHCAPSNRLSP